MKTKNILAIDTSNEICSVSLRYNGEIYSLDKLANQAHTQMILGQIEQLLKQANISLTDLDLIAYAKGPGSFTGIRIAASVAKSLAFALDLPIIGVSTLSVLAWQGRELYQKDKIIVALDARMQEVYATASDFSLFSEKPFSRDNAHIVLTERVIAPELLATQLLALDENNQIDLSSYLCIGSGFINYAEKFDKIAIKSQILSENSLPLSRYILTLLDHEKPSLESYLTSEPTYLRNNVAKKKSSQ